MHLTLSESGVPVTSYDNFDSAPGYQHWLMLAPLAKRGMATDGLSMLSFAYGSDESDSSGIEDEGAERKHHTSNRQSMAKKRKIGEDERSVKMVKPR